MRYFVAPYCFNKSDKMSGNRLRRRKPDCGILPDLPDQTMTPGRMRVDTDGYKEAKKHAYERQGTVTDFRRAYMIGGGDFGAAVHGTPDNYIYHIAKNDLWWDYYDHTGDTEFLREVGYPLLKDAATFYHGYLLTASDGERYIFPSRSQEFVNAPGLTNEFMTNSTIDLCMFRNTFDKAAKAARILDTDAELAEAWEADLAEAGALPLNDTEPNFSVTPTFWYHDVNDLPLMTKIGSVIYPVLNRLLRIIFPLARIIREKA